MRSRQVNEGKGFVAGIREPRQKPYCGAYEESFNKSEWLNGNSERADYVGRLNE